MRNAVLYHISAGVYKVPYAHPNLENLLGRNTSCEEGKIISGEEYNVEKRDRGSNIIYSLILRLLGRILSGEENFGEENQDFEKNGDGEEYQVVRNFIDPCISGDIFYPTSQTFFFRMV